MTEARWARLSEVFHRAIELSSGQERDAWLDQTCGADLSLRRNVQRLLDAHAAPSLANPAARLEMPDLELAPGDRLAHYRVEAKIGQGGMGVVYRAFDTRLHRLVALKVLPPLYAASEDCRHRLRREARAASSLNHPNIVTVHEAGNDQDLDFIAMEYIDGAGLGERIGDQGMPVPQLVRYALQITGALSAAHAAKILHRDVKPSNIMVTREDRIKVLDFGLARLMEPGEEQLPDPTLTGQVRGTPAYMSPEQAEGRKLDARSDVFSLGCVLYQMAVGHRPFEGDSYITVMYRITNEAPRRPAEIVALPPDLEALILRCLEKDPARRFQSMDELKSALQALDMGARPRRTGPAARRLVRRLPIAAAAIVLLVVAGWTVSRLLPWGSSRTVPRRPVKFAITPANLRRGGPGEVDSEVSVSRDGKHIAYVESPAGQLWIRDIDSERARPVPGATAAFQVFWAPDNQWVGYASGEACAIRPGCELMKIPVTGGTPRRIVTIGGGIKRAAWSSDGRTIVYCDSRGLYTVPADGGAAARIIEHAHIEHPSLIDLPGGRRAFLYQALDAEHPGHALYLQVVGESRRRLLKVSESTNPYPAWSPTGHVVYVDGPNFRPSIWALPVSLSSLSPSGSSFRIVESGSAPMVSATGTLVYGDPPSSRLQLAWVDRSGKRVSTVSEPRVQSRPLLSPDGRRVAVVVREPGWDLAVYDSETGVQTQLTSDRNSEALGSWTGGGITYVSFTTREWAILSKPAEPGAAPKQWLQSSSGLGFPEWSPDGRFLIYNARGRESQGDLLYRERRGAGELGGENVFLRTPAHEAEARFSPDGRYVAYVSDETGPSEIYVRGFPNGEQRWKISANGGGSPRWRRDGLELFYAAGARLMAASVTLSPSLQVGTPVKLFEKPSAGFLQFDAAAGGRRFIVLERPAAEPPLSVHVVQDWFEEFRNRK